MRKELSLQSHEAVSAAISSHLRGKFGEKLAERGIEETIKPVWHCAHSLVRRFFHQSLPAHMREHLRLLPHEACAVGSSLFSRVRQT